MAQSLQGLDRTIFELRSKNDDVKVKAANELRENVVLYSRGNLEVIIFDAGRSG